MCGAVPRRRGQVLGAEVEPGAERDTLTHGRSGPLQAIEHAGQVNAKERRRTPVAGGLPRVQVW